MNAVSKALVTCSGTSQLKNQSSASAKEFAKKYVDNLDQVPQMRPSHSLLARNLHEYQEDPKLKADIQDATAQLLSVNGFSIKSNFSLHLRLKIENRGMFGQRTEDHRRDFPIFIRSKTLRDAPVADVE